MNILYLTTHLNIGGISSYLLTLAKGLKKRRHQVYLAAGGGELVGKFKAEGISYIPIPIKTKAEINPKILISFFQLLRVIKKENIDIIHANTRVTQVLACLLQKYTDKPFISTCHGFFKKRLLRKLFPCWGKKVIAISLSVKEHLTKDFGIKEGDIRVVPNGIDLDKFRSPNSATEGSPERPKGVPSDRRESREKSRGEAEGRNRGKVRSQVKKNLGLDEGPVVGIIARLSDVKGHKYLIRAMQAVIADIPQAQLLIVGSGREGKALGVLTRQLQIEKNVRFIPSVSDTKDLLLAMDLFVMPSLKEGLGLGLMEAMASGLSVIGSDVGGIKNLIQDNYTGRLVSPKDVKKLSDTIINLLADPEKRKYLGANAQDFISRNFSQEKMAQETERVYQECLNAKD